VRASLLDSLGVFSKLPPEIRREIWQYFRPENQTCFGNCTWETSLAILRTSKQIHDEITTEMYNNRVLRLLISPKSKEDVVVKDLPRGNSRSSGLANFSRFKCIDVAIEPPSVDDPDSY